MSRRYIFIVGYMCIAVLLMVGTRIHNNTQDHFLYVSMLDVGQGDSFYVRTPNGTDILIDTGANQRVLGELTAVMPFSDHTIEYVFLTHDDRDHVGEVSDIAQHFHIQTLVLNALSFPRGISHTNDRVTETFFVDAGNHFDFGDGVTVDVVSPDDHTTGDDNMRSLVLVLHFDQIDILFTGDAPQEIEEKLIAEHAVPRNVELLKVGHHGSHTATSAAWVAYVHPRIALISAGKGNSYGHPHAGPLWRLEHIGVQIFRTDRDSRVVCKSDGVQLTCKRSSLFRLFS